MSESDYVEPIDGRIGATTDIYGRPPPRNRQKEMSGGECVMCGDWVASSGARYCRGCAGVQREHRKWVHARLEARFGQYDVDEVRRRREGG